MLFKQLVDNILQVKEEKNKDPIHIDITSENGKNYMKIL